ncbi:hypothetical protein [Pelagibius litoralis]|uniref:hypothetical protein n=1 Tax=Pelagibius litoralis TaxID=374515 RepID=UPI0014240662|nr:hypothetical protein [Pelagibius litoralis]
MPSLADLRDPYAAQNRQKRDFAYSGQADTADIPWLYAIEAGQGRRGPSGIGEGQGGGADDAAAPNPMSLASLGGGGSGGGSSGAADVGLPGPGLSGEEDIESLGFLGDRGSDRGFGGGGSFDRGFGDPVGIHDEYTPLDGLYGDVLDVAGFGPQPFGAFAALMKGGARGANASILDQRLRAEGLPGVGFWENAMAVLGLNDLGVGTLGNELDTFQGQLGEAGRLPSQYEGRSAEELGGGYRGAFDPGIAKERAVGRVGPLGFFGDEVVGGNGSLASLGGASAAGDRGGDRGGRGGRGGGRGGGGSGSSRGGRDRSQRD